MTPEEQKQVQNIINARTKLFSEKISQQENLINTLSSQLDDKDKELEGLRTQLEESQKLNSSLQAEIEKLKSLPVPAPLVTSAQVQEIPKPQKPSYLVSLLRQHFALDSFRPGQEEVIDAILSGRDIFCSMPENYESSICYRLPALLMPGLTLIIMKSEQNFPEQDSHSAFLSAKITPAKKRELFRSIKSGSIKLLYSTPELLSAEDTASALKSCEISSAVILVSGEKRKTACEFLDSLSKKRIARGIFADSTSPAERQEIFKYLRSPARIITGFNRPEISLSVFRTENRISSIKEFLADKKDFAGVIFCTTPETSWKLRENLRDIPSLDEKIIILPSILYHQVMRKDIRFVIHYDLPKDLAAYSQEINIAGLDGQKSECIMLASRKDLISADNSIVKFCSAKNPKDFMLSYLGEDERFALPTEQEENDNFMPEDFSDFDFGTANESQKEAITSMNGPVLIIAGPGTGKTYTLVQRAVFMIQKKHVKPENIMLATFTDKAAQELITRIAEALASRNIRTDTSAMYTGTFHAICSRILRDYADFTGLGKTFRILDDFGHAYMIMQNFKLFDAIDGIERVFKNPGKWKRSCELRDYINTLSEELTDPEELMRDENIAAAALGQAIIVHDKMLKDNQAMSYSALLAETYRLLRDNPEILEGLQKKINYIMIDEYQDTNYIQEQLVFLLGSNSRNICVVGDDDQSLYRFRGATVRNILEFPDKWGKNECKVIRLMLNYRSTPAIIKFASQWMEETGEFFSWGDFRYSKKLEAFKPEASYPSVIRLAGIGDKEDWHDKILTFIKSLRESGKLADYNQIAFLFRSVKAKSVQELSHFLESNNINVYSPRSNLFFSRPEIRFAIGCLISMFPEYLKNLEEGKFTESDAVSYYRECVKNLKRFIDKPAYSGLKKFLRNKRTHHSELKGYTGCTYSDLIYELFAFEPFTHVLDAEIGGNVKDLRPARNLSRLVQVFRDYERSYNISNISAKNLALQFQMMMNIYIRFRIDEGLDEYESEFEAVPSGHVAFMTIHQAKGREFPIVFADSLWSVPDSELRHDRNNQLMNEIAENYSRRPAFEPLESIKFFDFWRMYYVAFTRAQNLLVLTCNENTKTPSTYLEGAYNRLEDADDIFRPSEIEITPQKDSELRDTYSFTSQIMIYETCPMQYKFLCGLEFPQKPSQATILGKLVHSVIEDIHRAVLNNEEKKITEPVIHEWLNAEYEKLQRNGEGYLNETSRENAFAQVMRYVNLQGDDWSGIVLAEADVNLVRKEYILEGRIDLVRTRDGETEIIDFKSGTKPNININSDRERLEECRRQINVYAYLAAKSLGLNVARMRLYYTGEEGSSREIIYPYDESTAEEIVKVLDEDVHKILALDYDERTSKLESCEECAFKYYCGRA